MVPAGGRASRSGCTRRRRACACSSARSRSVARSRAASATPAITAALPPALGASTAIAPSRLAERARARALPADARRRARAAAAALAGDRRADPRATSTRRARAGEQLRARAERDGDDVLVRRGRTTCSASPPSGAATSSAARAPLRGRRRALPASEHRATHLLRYGQDPQLVCLIRLANTLCLLGEREGASRPASARSRWPTRSRTRRRARPRSCSHRCSRSTWRRAGAARQTAALNRSGRRPQGGRRTGECLAAFVDVLDGRPDARADRIRRVLADVERARPAPGRPRQPAARPGRSLRGRRRSPRRAGGHRACRCASGCGSPRRSSAARSSSRLSARRPSTSRRPGEPPSPRGTLAERSTAHPRRHDPGLPEARCSTPPNCAPASAARCCAPAKRATTRRGASGTARSTAARR